MRAFLATWRSFVGFYSELFLLLGLSLLWWVTGGIAVGLIIVFGFPLLQVGGPFWLAPLLAIPAGPATAAMAFVARRVARELHVDRSFYWDGWKAYWRKALALNAISMVILALLLLNLIFYFTRTNVLQALSLFWAYLIVFWLSVQVYLFPVLVGLKEPSILGALRTSIALAFANPLFSIITAILVALLTGLSVVIPILLLFAWPAVMALMGEHSLMVFVERAGGIKEEKDEE